MFPKPTFGGTTSGFGSFSSSTAAASPFGGFKPATQTSAFGAPPAFGAATAAQPTAGGGLFGTTNTTGGLFGGTTSAAPPAFGAANAGFGFGASTSAGGLFTNNTSTGLFGATQNNSAFGAKPAGFGFGSTAPTNTTGGLFGATPTTGTGLFGQQTNTLSGGGLFSNNTGAFGQQPTAAGTAHVKYNPVVGTDVVVKSGTSQNISIKHHCITCMKEYENKSLEELRLEDYTAGRKGSAAGGMFGGFQPQPADNKPMFGGSTFGQPATTTTSSVFGGGGITSGGFGQTNTFSFGNNTQNATNTTGLFGAAKPAFGAAPTTGTSLFGATTTQAPTFGTTTPSFGFGSNTQNQPGSLFGAKPATSAFGTTPASSGFGAFGAGGGLFGAKPAQTTAPAFGTAAPAFGNMSGGFGANTSTTGSLFGANSAFGKPAVQPAFGFNTPATGLGGGLAGGLGGSFAKPAAPAFGNLGGGTLFQTQPQNNFSTGVDNSLGGGIFGNNSALGGSALGLGLGNTSLNANTLSGSAAAVNVHEQILTLVARPYGDSPLFKDLVPETPVADNALKPTNPAAVKAVLAGASGAHRVTSPHAMRLKVQPRAPALTHDKKSLFDGLEESDASLEDKLTLRPSRKRLVLRPRAQQDEHNDSMEQHATHSNRSLEDPQRHVNGQEQEKENELRPDSFSTDDHRARRDAHSYGENNNLDSSSNKYASWLHSTRLQPSAEKENPMDGESTPRLYPNLDKELPSPATERRASWLTTKPLRKPLAPSPADAVDNSVRELGIRPERSHDKDIDVLSASPPREHLQFCCHRWGKHPACSSCEKITHQIAGVYVSEDENESPRDLPPHPTGVKLTRPGYYTIPTLDDMIKYMRPDGSCVVPHLTIGRKNYGNVYYDCEIDVAGLDIDSLVHFLNKEVTIYPDDSVRPPVGEGLNRRAIVTLDRIWPRDKTEKKPITDPERLLSVDYEGKLRRVCDKHDTKFVEYRPRTGSWVFRVEHFSKYSLNDSDEDDELTPEVLKRQLVTQQLQTAAPTVPPKPPATVTATGLGGLGGPSAFGGPALSNLSQLGNLSGQTVGNLSGQALGNLSGQALGNLSGQALGNLSGPGGFGEDNLYAMQQTSLNLLNGAGKAFEMDTTEDSEAPSLYQDTHRAYGVKSPTSELARLEHRQSHNVQLMKASLYADTEMEDDASVSTGDQMVPRGAPLLSVPSLPPSVRAPDDDVIDDVSFDVATEELAMKPLIVRPHTIVLKYHRKVPPFKQTIAGRLDAACLADMSVCRARHSRVGFGPAGALVYATSYDAVVELPKNGELCDLGKYVCGRSDEDWSEPVVARLALGQADTASTMLDTLTRQLETLLEYSTVTECGPGRSARVCVRAGARSRRDALRRLVRDGRGAADTQHAFGVSGAYCHEVFTLCEALWGADLDNDGVVSSDAQSVVTRHRELLSWLAAAVAETTDRELAQPRKGEQQDEGDGHSARVWTLLLGGRVLEACQVARQHGDINMATLIAQAAGDPTFRSLLSRQLSLWRECGADTLVSSHRLAALRLLAGVSSPRDQLADTDWMRALHATARYLCPQVPSLEQVIRKYESFFACEGDGESGADLSVVGESGTDDMGMRYPLPPYVGDYDVAYNGQKRRVLDLRYELLRARAMNARPRLQPAAYTADPLDYSLCFVLGAWLGTPSVASITGVADQLEAAGAWHLAVLALSYHPDDRARGHLIRGVLSRHAPARALAAEQRARLQLVRRLGVPERWLLLAQASRAKYEHLPAVEADHLVRAEQWNAAHAVLLEQLLPEAVLADNLQSLSPLLDALNSAAERHEVSGWASGGQALHHYLHVCDEIRGLVSSAEADRDRASVHARLEALRPRVAAACRALGRLDARSPRHAAARTEMGARLVQLALAAGEPPQHLAALLKALKLPPDCTQHAQHKITTDLAEQASELCIESASSSPHSSHHRATVPS